MNVRPINRRGFLLSGLGAALAAPVLKPLEAQAQSVPTKRFIAMFTPNGTIAPQWKPTGTETNFTLSPILKPLEPFKSKLLILDGVQMTSTTAGPGSAHMKGMGHFLTGIELLPGSMTGGAGDPSGYSSGISVDQFIANQIRPGTPFPTLEFSVGASSAGVRTRMSYLGSNQPIPPMNDPYQAFMRVFSNVMPGGDMTALRRLQAERRSMLDLAMGELTSLSNRLGTGDRERLQEHLASIREVEARLTTAATAGAGCRLPMVGARMDPAATANYPAIGQLQMDLIAAAFSCGLTRIATFIWSGSTSQQTFPWLGINDGHHNLSHLGDNDTVAQAKLVKINTWYAEQFAYLLGKLNAVAEGQGTLLDNTVVLWGNELGKGNTHTRNQIPYVLAGSCGGYFRVGRYVQYNYQSPPPHNNLLLSIAKAMGVNATTFGNPRFCTGLLANLA